MKYTTLHHHVPRRKRWLPRLGELSIFEPSTVIQGVCILPKINNLEITTHAQSGHPLPGSSARQAQHSKAGRLSAVEKALQHLTGRYIAM